MLASEACNSERSMRGRNIRRGAEARIKFAKLCIEDARGRAARLNDAIRWLGENASGMGEGQRDAAFIAISRHVKEKECANPLEAGLSMKLLADGLDTLEFHFKIKKHGLMRRMAEIMETGPHGRMTPQVLRLVMEAGGMGMPSAIRMLMFWESQGIVAGVAGRLEATHPEEVKSIREQMGAGIDASRMR